MCRWEDDVVQLRWPSMAGGANRVSLIDAQRQFARTRARATPGPEVQLADPADYEREPSWRPIDPHRDRFEPDYQQLAPWPDDCTLLYWWRHRSTTPWWQHPDVDHPVKGAAAEVPIPMAWRSTLAAVGDALARRDATVAPDLPSVDPIPPATWQQCLQAVDDYGDVTLTALPDASWNTSVALWFGDRWRCLVDLWTEEEGRSDLVLDVDVFEDGSGYRFCVNLVYVP